MGNETYTSVTKDKHGVAWIANFELYPFFIGLNMIIYKGLMFVPGDWYSRKKAVIKVPREIIQTTKEPCSSNTLPHEIKLSRKAEELLDEFIKIPAVKDSIDKFGFRIHFTRLLAATMESVSGWNTFFRVISRSPRRLRKGEMILIEERLEGKFKTFVDKTGNGENSDPLLEALCHFSYVQSNKELVMCNLKGVREGNSLTLSVPIVHSVDNSYGSRDEGSEGIRRFFDNHKCSSLCNSFGDYSHHTCKHADSLTNLKKVCTRL